MHTFFKTFALSIAIWIVALVAVYIWGGAGLLVTAALLTVLEVTLSFDNAVVNARILSRMNELWQRRFLTWGILVAVFGTRFVLPILIVAAGVWISPIEVAKLALFEPETYGALLESAHYSIASFGGMFLLMVSLKYFFDSSKEVHWIKVIEKHISRWGRIEAIEIAISLFLLLLIAFLVPLHASQILFAGIIGIVLFILMQGIANSFQVESEHMVATGSAMLFIYLNILDSAFSLDGVVGAFAVTNNLLAIVVGLGVGAYFVRTLTVYLVRQKTLDTLRYLEHGAHYAIFGLALAMLVGLLVHVPEVISGLVGIVFVLASYWSSIKAQKKVV